MESARERSGKIQGGDFRCRRKCAFRRASVHVTVPEVKAVSHWRLVSSVPACLPFLPGNNETQRGRVYAYVREPTMACKCSLFTTSLRRAVCPVRYSPSSLTITASCAATRLRSRVKLASLPAAKTLVPG